MIPSLAGVSFAIPLRCHDGFKLLARFLLLLKEYCKLHQWKSWRKKKKVAARGEKLLSTLEESAA